MQAAQKRKPWQLSFFIYAMRRQGIQKEKKRKGVVPLEWKQAKCRHPRDGSQHLLIPEYFFWSQQSLWLRTPTIQLEQSLFLFWMTGVITLLESQLYCKNISDSLGQTAVYKSPTVGRLLIMRETKVLNCRQINY